MTERKEPKFAGNFGLRSEIGIPERPFTDGLKSDIIQT